MGFVRIFISVLSPHLLSVDYVWMWLVKLNDVIDEPMETFV